MNIIAMGPFAGGNGWFVTGEVENFPLESTDFVRPEVQCFDNPPLRYTLNLNLFYFNLN